MKIGSFYATTSGTLWKDGTYFPAGTRVMVSGLHLDQGFCVRFPTAVDGQPLETWEEWTEAAFLAEEGSVELGRLPAADVLAEARKVLCDADDGCHLHLHDED
ncbi:MAG: hypothetical protein ACYDA5_03785 [Vulcanimicrobiaceae bacterium]